MPGVGKGDGVGRDSPLVGKLLDGLRHVAEYREGRAISEALELRDLPPGVDPGDLSQTGWAVIFGEESRAAGEYLLGDLIERRSQQAGSRFHKKVVTLEERGDGFLWLECGESPGVIDLDRLPYYVLLVGSPEEVSFDFQMDLAVNRSVGRICFDRQEELSSYADAVLAVERVEERVGSGAAFFGFETDEVTNNLGQMIEQFLLSPFSLEGDWNPVIYRDGRPSREDLLEKLSSGDIGFLSVLAHGLKLGFGDPSQRDLQGAFITRKDPDGRVDQYLDRRMIERRWTTEERPFLGIVALLVVCYGAGTPDLDAYSFLRSRQSWREAVPEVLAEHPFVAGLPQALLSRGALAVLGHVDRAFTSSFLWRTQEGTESPALRSLQASLRRLARGDRVGHALRPLFRRFSYIAAHLLPMLEAWRSGWQVEDELIENHLLTYVDARNYLLLGDPAVRAAGASAHGEEWAEEARTETASELPGAVPVYFDESLLGRARKLVGSEKLQEWVHQTLREQLDQAEAEASQPSCDDPSKIGGYTGLTGHSL